MAKTDIQWTDLTWNFLRGCSMVSDGCRYCYAMKMAHRFSGAGKAYEGLTELGPDGPRWTGKIRVVEEKLEEPLRVKKPQRWFVNSMSDLFHEDVPFEVIDKAFAVMALTPHHTYQILTKRPERMREYFAGEGLYGRILRIADQDIRRLHPGLGSIGISDPAKFPAKWIWLGVSVENQRTANERIPLLLQTPAAVRFVSYEPALGPVDFREIELPPEYNITRTVAGRIDALTPDSEARYWSAPAGLDWIIVGGESGAKARRFEVDWARRVVGQCKAANVACFVKQLGAYPIIDPRYDRTISGATRKLRDSHGGDPDEWPEDLRVRQFPNEREMEE